MSPDNLRNFEEQLKSVRPRKVNPELEVRIREELRLLARRKRFARIRMSVGWAGLALAASILLTFAILLFNGRIRLEDTIPGLPVAEVDPEPSPVVSVPDERVPFKQVLTENNLLSRIDEGIVFLKNGMTARRYRYQFVDRVVWANPSSGSRVELEVPRDEIVLIPVQTF